MIKSKNFVISMDVYPFDLIVSVGETDEMLFNKLRSLGIDESEIDGAKYAENIGVAKYCLFETGQSLIRIRRTPKTPTDYGNLQHEIFHCASAVLWKIGVKLKIKTSDEAYAYLIDYLTRKIYSKL